MATKNIKYPKKANTKGAPSKSPNIISRSVVPGVSVIYKIKADIIAHKVKIPGTIIRIWKK